MTAQDARKRIDAFLSSGQAGTVTLNVAAAKPRGKILGVEIKERFSIDHDGREADILDMVETRR